MIRREGELGDARRENGLERQEHCKAVQKLLVPVEQSRKAHLYRKRGAEEVAKDQETNVAPSASWA